MDDALVEAVQTVVATHLARGVPAIDTIARQLSMSSRTLQRRLADHGSSYQEVIERTRRTVAERLLDDRAISVSQVGFLVGFSEPSAFHRAFRRWHSMTPQEFRRRGRAD